MLNTPCSSVFPLFTCATSFLYSSCLPIPLALILSIMLDSFEICLAPLLRSAKTFLKRLRAIRRMSEFRRRKPCTLSSKFYLSTTSFATMEVSNQFKEVFKVIDINGDGKISPLELGEVLLCFGYDKSIAFKEAEGMISAMDCDGDGLIDLGEFMDVMNSSKTLGVEKEGDNLMDAFYFFDVDKNGLISPRELHRVLISLGSEGCSLEECRRMIKAVDKDGDGFVDFEDFRSMMTRSAH